MQDPEPATEYLPATHWLAVAVVDPAAHAYPAVHAPVHWLVVAPAAPYRPASQGPTHWALVWAVVPYRPAAQLPVQADVVRPAVAPYRPAAQSVQTPEPATEYLPATHSSAVALVEAAAQAYPAVQLPVHVATVMALVAPYRPAAHRLQVPAPSRLYCPAGHVLAVGLVLPAAKA